MTDHSSAGSLASLATVTVTFNPDVPTLERQLLSLHGVGRIVVVDNASAAEILPLVREVVRRVSGVMVELAQNAGLAAGLNAGIANARDDERVRYVLLLDQDSEFAADVPGKMLDSLIDIEATSGRMACVGPTMRDTGTGLSHGFHVLQGWRWTRVYPSVSATQPIAVTNLNGSGTLMSLDLADRAGPLDEAFFIDHVDTEWSFRVLSLGFGLYGLPWLSFVHHMGESSRRFWMLGWRVWPERSPFRHYYLFRNTMRLLRRDYVPLVWKSWAVVKLAVTMTVTFVIDPRRFAQLRMMLKGVSAGWRK